MKTFATKDKHSAPATHRSRPSRFGYRGPEVKAQQAKIRRILRSTGAQAKLTIGQPNDKYEQETDRVADQVMRMSDADVAQRQPEKEAEEETLQAKPLADQITPLVQRQEEPPEEEEEQEGLQTKALHGMVQRKAEAEDEDEEALQTKAVPDHTPTVGATTHADIQSLKGGGQPLPPNQRTFYESRMGHDFSGVRIHADSKAADAAQQVQAKAFTLGKDIAFNSDQYTPGTQEGKKLLAHELTHVVQQSSKIQPRVQRFRVVNVANVSSLKIEEWEGARGAPATNWTSLQNRMTRRVNIITRWISTYGNRHASFTLMSRLLKRWPSLKRLLGNARFNPATGVLPANRAMQAARTDELADLTAVRALGRGARFVAGEIQNFLNTLDAYTNSRATLHDERTEYHRFDNLFTARDVQTLVAAITQHGVGWTTADVKAVVSQETGDLTDTSVVGIAPKARGIVTRRARSAYHRRTYIGLGQHATAARANAITWAAGNGVVIPTRPDPRTIPAEAIKLTAAYLGWVADRMNNGLPAPTPVGDEFKKFVFAAYNWGHGNVLRVTTAAPRGAGAYTWATVAPRMRQQTRNYVDEIVSRLR